MGRWEIAVALAYVSATCRYPCGSLAAVQTMLNGQCWRKCRGVNLLEECARKLCSRKFEQRHAISSCTILLSTLDGHRTSALAIEQVLLSHSHFLCLTQKGAEPLHQCRFKFIAKMDGELRTGRSKKVRSTPTRHSSVLSITSRPVPALLPVPKFITLHEHHIHTNNARTHFF